MTICVIAFIMYTLLMDHNFGKEDNEIPKWEMVITMASCVVMIVTLAIGSVMGIINFFS